MAPRDTGSDSPKSTVVSMAGVHFAWQGTQRFTIDVDAFDLTQGERLLILGPSGSGKSTLLSLLAGIVTPSRGELSVLGTDIAKLSASARDRFRAEHMGIIFQMFNLLPYGSVTDNVALPLSFAPARRQRVLESGSIESEAKRLLESLGLTPQQYAGLKASELSVGQQQRVAAARALIGRPELVVADEPTSALDHNSQQAFLDLLFAQTESAGTTVIMVSHDESLGKRFDRVIRLDDFLVATRQGRVA